MEESAIYETIDLSKPWDDPANSQAREAFIGVYRCPSDSLEDDKTTYLSIVGPDCAITNAILRNSSEFSDEFAKTIVVIEASPDQAVHWMSPNDIELQSDLKFDADTRTAHPGIIIAAFLDGHIKEIPLESVAERLQKMLATAEPAPASE